MTPNVSRRTKIGFGAGEFSSSIFFTITSFWLMNFLTDEVRLSAALAGSALLVGKIWDARHRSLHRPFLRPHPLALGAPAALYTLLQHPLWDCLCAHVPQSGHRSPDGQVHLDPAHLRVFLHRILIHQHPLQRHPA